MERQRKFGFSSLSKLLFIAFSLGRKYGNFSRYIDLLLGNVEYIRFERFLIEATTTSKPVQSTERRYTVQLYLILLHKSSVPPQICQNTYGECRNKLVTQL